MSSCKVLPGIYKSSSFTITSQSPEEGHPSPKVQGKYCFCLPRMATSTKRGNKPIQMTARSRTAVAKRKSLQKWLGEHHTLIQGVAPFRGPAPFGGYALSTCMHETIVYSTPAIETLVERKKGDSPNFKPSVQLWAHTLAHLHVSSVLRGCIWA